MDQGFETAVVEQTKKIGMDVEVIEHNPTTSVFVPQPIRWVVEQVKGITMLVRDCEHQSDSTESRASGP